VPRALVLIPPSRALFHGALPVGPGYPRPYSDAEMRAWSDDLGRLYRTIERDRGRQPGQRRLDALLAAPRDRLGREERGVVDAHRQLLAAADQGIKGDLRTDGRVELSGGRHRAHYVLERQSDPVPVWVSCRESGTLERFRSACQRAVERSRPDLRLPDRAPTPERGPVRSQLERAR